MKRLSKRDQLLKNDILCLAVTRKSMRTVAACLSDLDAAEARRFLPTLMEELQMLIDGDTSSMVWRQVTSTLDGPQGYGIERIGLLPPFED